MLGENWVTLAILLLAASIIFHQVPLLMASVLLLLTAGVSSLWRRFCLRELEYERDISSRRVFFGEEVDLRLRLVNRKLLPLAWLEIEDEVPEAVTFLKGEVQRSHKPLRMILRNILSLRWYERVTRRYPLRCDSRGYHSFGPATIRSGDIFGFFNVEANIPKTDYLLVYPKVVPITRLGIPSKQPFGDIKTRQHIFEDPVRTIGVRPYAPGDSPRRLHWKATARTQELQVKLFEPTTTIDFLLFLNVATFSPIWAGVIPSRLELAVTTAASLANYATEERYRVGLYVNSNLPGSDQQVRILPSRSPDQLTRMFEALAKISGFATVPMERFLQRESRNLPWGATVVVITATANEALLSTLLRLKRTGHRTSLVLVGDDAPKLELDGITVHNVRGQWREIEELQLA
ncbi:MAG: DUF58 domain-containing protein [Chloroflexi bacterium]|nr:DUF58 domain-containing protein [Chloroflexota bacterium]